MKFDAHFGDAEAIQLKAAILLYGGAKRITFASVHEPYRDPAGGAPYLDAGRPISTEFLRALARGLGLGSAGLASLGESVEGFFQSEFTHAGNVKITSHHEGHLGLWRDLAGRTAFPPEWLIRAGTLEEWLCRGN